MSGKKRGRPSKYDPINYPKQVEKLCRLGATDREIADFFEVNEFTIARWKHRYTEFGEAIKRSKEELDAQVEKSLFRRAMGYTFKSEKIFNYQGTIVRAETEEHCPPDAASMIFWLKNRKPGEWRNAPIDPNADTKPPLIDDDADIP
jgi:hypothetical protein